MQAIGRRRDPGELQAAPLVRWAKEWWAAARGAERAPGVLTLGELRGTFKRIAGKVPGQGSWRTVVKGPLSAAIWACRLVQWDFKDAGTIVDEDGAEVSLMCMPPSRIQQMYARALRRVEVRQAIEKRR